MADQSWYPEPESGVQIRFVEANGQTFELAEAGKGGRLALCLHGFPELNYAWRFQMPMLVQQGWRVWAPNLRGYGASSRPDGVRAYALDHLIDDVAALIDASGAKEVLLIAHDWGAIIAWIFAIRKVRPLAGLIIMNVPHPMVARREIRKWRQFKRSWYVFFFQLPILPEASLKRNNGKAIARVFQSMACDKSRFPDSVVQPFVEAARRPCALTAMINYYRALIRFRKSVDIGDGRVDVPTLMIWGEQDTALNIHCTEGTEDYVADFRLERLPNVSHWVQQEAPEKVNAIMSDWLNAQLLG